MRLTPRLALRTSFLALASILSACTATSTADDEEVVLEASSALSTSVIATYASGAATAVEATNGKKVVFAGGTFHAVFSAGGVVRYTSSSDGITWSASQIVDATNAQHPTIAVAADGTVGVAYARGFSGGAGSVHYARRPAGGSWQTPVLVTSDGNSTSSRNPSIVADGNTMHLAWARGARIHYASFPASQSASLAAAEGVNSPLALGVTASLPAVMVGPGPSGTRVIRVAFFENIGPSAGNPGTVWFHIGERGPTSWPYPIYFDAADYTSTATVVSSSIDVNPSTGDSYAAGSSIIDGAGRTFLVRENTLTPGASFVYHEILPTSAAQISVAARTEQCQSRFRVMVSTPWNGYGTAWVRKGTWTSGSSPTWIDPAPVSLPAPSRAATALLTSKTIPGTGQSRTYHGVFEQVLGAGNYEYRNAFDVIDTPESCE